MKLYGLYKSQLCSLQTQLAGYSITPVAHTGNQGYTFYVSGVGSMDYVYSSAQIRRVSQPALLNVPLASQP